MVLSSQPTALDHYRRHWIFAEALAVAGLIFFALYYLTGFRFDTLFTVEARQVDFTIWRYAPTYILEHGRYPAMVTGDWVHTIFPYLPSAAAMMLPLSLPPQAIGFAIWLVIEAVAFAFVIWASLRMSGAFALRGPMLIAIAAVLLSESALGWDFRNHNNNIVYLALVMLGLVARNAWLAAIPLALSFNLKLYSGPMMLAFVWRREYRLATAMVLAVVLIAVLLPVSVFGASAFPQLLADWVAQIHYTFMPDIQATTVASLLRSAVALLGADPGSNEVFLLVRSMQATWAGLVIGYFIFAGRPQLPQKLHYNQARLADMCVALMAPLPLSSWLLPYHAVVVLPAFLLLLTVAAEPDQPKWLRGALLAACAACQAVRFTLRDWSYRGVVYLAIFIILIFALAVVRRALTRQSGIALQFKNAIA